MIITCFVCNENFSQIASLTRHYKDHSYENVYKFPCTYENCDRYYSRLPSLQGHLFKEHDISQSTSSSYEDIIPIEIVENTIDTTAENQTPDQYSLNVNSPADNIDILSFDKFIEEFKDRILKQTLKLFSNPNCSRSMARTMLIETFDIYLFIFRTFKQLLQKNEANILKKYENYFLFIENFKIYTEYKFFRELEKLGLLVKTYRHHIATKTIILDDSVLYEKVTIEVMPLQLLFSSIFQMKNFLPELLKRMDYLYLQTESIENVIQSKLWKKKMSLLSQSPDVLYVPLTLSFDDFEPLNTVGSHAGAYKIGATYLQISCLPIHLASTLDFIHLGSFCFSNDRKEQGNTKTFTPLIKELNKLQTDGFAITHDRYRIAKLILVFIVGDNLGLNQILGFTEGFQHYFYCRFCDLPKNILMHRSIANQKRLRNPEKYEEDLKMNRPDLTGVYERSVWNNLLNFHVTENLSADFMHDVLEGMCHKDLGNILFNFIYGKKVLFDLNTLNMRMKSCYYGPGAQKPDVIDKSMITKKRFRFSASEMLTFVLNLPFIIGDLVPEDRKEWKLYILLRRLISVCFERSIYSNSHLNLRQLTKEHHDLFQELFKDITPKLHIFCHYEYLRSYPRCMDYAF
jgi:hypothetical protein